MAGAKHRRKGDRVEREIVEAHRRIGVHSERYPLSGASRFRESGHDVDVYAFGRDQTPLVAEVKARKDGASFVRLEKWLGEYDELFLKRNRADPLVVMPWSTYERMMRAIQTREAKHETYPRTLDGIVDHAAGNGAGS